MGVPYTKQNHLHRQRREFHIWNNAQKTKENDIKMILSSLAYITPIRLPFCMSTDKREEREREIFVKKKKIKIGHKPIKNDKKNKIKDL